MTELLWAATATAASLAVMYLVCLRPMRRRRGDGVDPAAELARLRREAGQLRGRIGGTRYDAPG